MQIANYARWPDWPGDQTDQTNHSHWIEYEKCGRRTVNQKKLQSPVRQSAILLRPSVQEMLVHLKINRIWNLKLTFPTRKNPIGPKTSWNIFGRGSIRFKSQNLSHWETKDTWQVGPWTVDFVKFETNQIRKNTFVRQRRYVLHICREIFASWKFKLCDGHNVTLKMQKK